MTNVNELTEAQEKLLLELPRTLEGVHPATSNKLIALGLAAPTEEELVATEAGARRITKIRDARDG